MKNHLSKKKISPKQIKYKSKKRNKFQVAVKQTGGSRPGDSRPGGSTPEEKIKDRISAQTQFLKPEIESPNNLERYNKLVNSVSTRDRFSITGRELVVVNPPGEGGGELENYQKMVRVMATHQENLKEIEKTTSVISFLDLRGIVVKNNFKIVPHNTFICFISPLDMSISANFNEGKLFLAEIMNLTPEKYSNLFNFRIGLRFNSLKANKLPGEELPLIYSSCFANSYWYYPGQVYPEMKFNADYQTFRKDRYTEKFCYISYDGTKISRPEYNHDVIPLEQFRDPTVTSNQDIRLSEVVKCQSRYEEYRMIIVFSSRGLENRNEYTKGDLESLMNLEMINYHMVLTYEETIIPKKKNF